MSARIPNRCIVGVWLTLNYTFYCLSGFADTALLPSVHFCGHRAFTVCPLLWTPRFYCLPGFVDTTPLLSVHFCGHHAFTACPLLWTPCFYCLSTFADTTPLLPVHFCGHPAFTACLVLRTPRLYCLSTFVDTVLLLPVHFCGHHAFTACPLLWTPRFYRLSGFVDTFPSRQLKFQYTGIFNDAFLCVNDGLLPNILAFTLDFLSAGKAKFHNTGIFIARFLNKARQNRTFAKRNR